MVKINGEDWRVFRLWVLILRAVLIALPAVITIVLEWSYDKSERLLLWLDRKLPDPHKTNA